MNNEPIDIKTLVQSLGLAIELNQKLLADKAKLKNERDKLLEGFISTVRLLRKTEMYKNGGLRERAAVDELLHDLEDLRC